MPFEGESSAEVSLSTVSKTSSFQWNMNLFALHSEVTCSARPVQQTARMGHNQIEPRNDGADAITAADLAGVGVGDC